MPSAWIRVALLVGVAYFLIGRLFAVPTDHAHAWRVAAWLVSGVAYAAQIAYEHFLLRSPPRVTAAHAALTAAIGAFMLAIAGMVHSLSPGSAIRPTWFLALVAWPAIAAIPAFIVALVAATVLARLPRSSDDK